MVVNCVDQASGESWALFNGDSAEVLPGLPDHSVGLSLFSPPFRELFVYNASERDLGNSRSGDDFWRHFGFISRELRRVMQPGRNVCVHVAQVPLQKARDGVIGLSDFRGETIRHFVEQGFIFHGEVVIWKNAQQQAIRTHSKSLLFVQNRKDSSWSRPALADYVLVFRSPGENQVPIRPNITNDDWIAWASPIWQIATTDEDKALAAGACDIFDLAPGTPLLWYGIRETDTLQAAAGREAADDKHICPLQLGTIERCVRLWSNPGETVLSPFAGIGSEIFESVRLGRRGIGIELKRSYWQAAVRNLTRLEESLSTPDLFSMLDEDAESLAEATA